MKNSGIEWIGEIPDSWELQPLRGHLIEIKESNDPIQTTQVLSLTNKLGVIPYEEKGEQGNKSKEKYNEYKLAYPNTIVANSMNILIGSVGICNYFGCVSPVYYVFKPKDEQELKFLDYIFQSQPFQKELRKYAKGILEIRLRVSASDILRRQVAFPTIEKQKQITAFIDEKCGKIDELIAKQEKQIEKLKEYKQSVITEAVTKGLDKSAPLKDSGNDYIGNIPKHWESIKIKYICSMQAGKNLISEQISPMGDYPVYGGNGLRGYFGEYNYEGVCLLVGRQGALCGNVHHVEGKFWATEHAVITKPKTGVYLRYLFYLLIGANLNLYVSPTAAQPGLSVNSVQNIILCKAPIKEQQQIVDYLDEKCGKIDRLIAIKQEKIEKLQEYKKSLNYEYVTGKKEVV